MVSSSNYACEIYERAEMSMLDRRGVGWLALALFGCEGVGWGDDDQTADVVLHSGPWRLRSRPGLSDPRFVIGVARGIANWWLSTESLIGRSGLLEESIAVHLALPMPAFRVAARRAHFDIALLSREFVCPKPIVAIQLSRVRDVHRATARDPRRLRVAS